jgi:hypothetical protein
MPKARFLKFRRRSRNRSRSTAFHSTKIEISLRTRYFVSSIERPSRIR